MSNTKPQDSSDLLSRTLRTVVVLVGASVLFVGSLSLTAVFIASKATSSAEAGPGAPATSDSHNAPKGEAGESRSSGDKTPLHI